MIRQLKTLLGLRLRRAGYELRRIKRPTRLVFDSIPGWFSQDEAELLYLLAVMSRGRFLEIGHFLGRSTSAICEGIRDSGRVIEFNSYDLGFNTPEEFIAFYTKLYYRREFDVPKEYNDMVYSRGITTTSVAREHLARFQLDSYVHLISGDFTTAEATPYDFIFCDAMHDSHEIQANIAAITRSSADDCTWAFHDMTDANRDAVLAAVPTARFITRADTLGVFRYRSPKI
jgi:hypothetical protein